MTLFAHARATDDTEQGSHRGTESTEDIFLDSAAEAPGIFYHSHRPMPQNANRISLGVGIGVAGILVAQIAIWFHDYAAHHWTPPGRWMAVLATTAITFGLVLAQFWAARKTPKFWALFTVALIFHVGAVAALLRFVPHLPLLVMTAVVYPESLVLGFALAALQIPRTRHLDELIDRHN